MREHFYQKTWFKNTILISLPSLISVIGVVISIIDNQTLKVGLIIFSLFLMISLIIAVVYFGNQEDKVYTEIQSLKNQNIELTSILAHMENDYKTSIFTVTSFSNLAEKWAKNINSFANNIKSNGSISDKAWDKIKLMDSICLQCKAMIQRYCNDYDDSKISVGFILYKKDDKGEEWVHMISHSNLQSTRPRACKKETKLSDCIYHYADLIKEGLSDIEIAVNNEEIQRIFKKVSINTQLDKYTQYIAIPVYCSSNKLLGIFQIVTKYNCYIEKTNTGLIKFATTNVLPYSNLITLIDKIYKGLYISPTQINKEE